jgi:anti-sigma regulatory factor (Ser/Thr protein kinase)
MHTDQAPAGSDPSSRITLRATPEESAALECWTASLGAEFGLPQLLLRRIDLCLVEVVGNVIAYAYPRGSAGSIRIGFWREPAQIRIRIDDDGEAFDPTSYRVPPLPVSLKDAQPGGRGIRLIRHYAEQMSYQRDGATNRLTLVFRVRGGELRNDATAPDGDADAKHRTGGAHRAASSVAPAMNRPC